MSTEAHTIPDKFLKAADKAATSCFSGTSIRSRQGKLAIAKAIHDAVTAERAGCSQPRRKIIAAMCELPHTIDNERVEFRFDPRRPGHNALNQLITMLEVQFGASKEEA